MARLEIAVFLPLPSALLHSLAKLSVSHVELCLGPYATGGLTPPMSMVRSAISAIANGAREGVRIDLAVHAMVRPRAGDFVYTEVELAAMKDDVERLALLGVDAVVFGVLQDDGAGYVINRRACQALVQEAHRHGIRAVFHRAFDETSDWSSALKALGDCHFDAVLTAGGTNGVERNCERLAVLLPHARQLGIEVIVGGGVRSANLSLLKGQLEEVRVWHSAAIMEGSEVPDLDEVARIIDILGRQDI